MSYNNELSGFVVLDIETVGCVDAGDYLSPVVPPANYKDAEKIAAWCAEKQAERISKAAVEPDLCELVAVGWQIAGNATFCATSEVNPEIELLRAAWEAINSRIIIGFYSLSFDLPVLIRRSQLLSVRFVMPNLDKYRTPHIDLFERLTFNGKITSRSLSFYCKRFAIASDDTTTGADIGSMVAAGDWAGVEAHCRADVDKTAALARRLGYLR